MKTYTTIFGYPVTLDPTVDKSAIIMHPDLLDKIQHQNQKIRDVVWKSFELLETEVTEGVKK